MSGLMLISSILFTWVLWRTLVDLRWIPNGVHMAKSGVSNCTLIVTMSVQCGYLTRSLVRSWVYLTEWYFLCFSYLFVVVSVCLLAHCPYVSLGIVALWVKYRQVRYVFVCCYNDCCTAHISMTVFLCLPMRVGSNHIVSLFDLWWESLRNVHTCMTLHYVLFVF